MIDKTKLYGPIQPICSPCKASDAAPEFLSSTVVGEEEEQCCVCGEPTTEGIYIRVEDPTLLDYPTATDEKGDE